MKRGSIKMKQVVRVPHYNSGLVPVPQLLAPGAQPMLARPHGNGWNSPAVSRL